METNLKKMNRENGEIICSNLKLADSIDERMLGLMFKEEMPNCDGLLISPCNSIHTFFMKMSIDVVFLTKDYEVVKVFYNLKPWRMTSIYFKSRHVLEMKAGTLIPNLQVGESLRVYV
jgi:uncharacterized membrane protein (UPF0127 family)